MNRPLFDKLYGLFEPYHNFLDYEGLPVTFHKNIGASDSEIASLIENEASKLPEEYLDLLRHFNGFRLFVYEELSGFKFLGTAEIIEEAKLQKEIYGEDWDESVVIFCQLICDGDFIGFRFNQDGSYSILDCFHEINPNEWQVVSGSLEAFLEKLIVEKGKKFWLERDKKSPEAS